MATLPERATRPAASTAERESAEGQSNTFSSSLLKKLIIYYPDQNGLSTESFYLLKLTTSCTEYYILNPHSYQSHITWRVIISDSI